VGQRRSGSLQPSETYWRDPEPNWVGELRPNWRLTRQLTAVPLRQARRISLKHVSILILGLGMSACGWPGIDAYSETQQSSLSEEGETLEYLVTIELAPGALDEARRGYLSVRGSISGSGEDVPLIEVSGGDPLTVSGRVNELSLFEFEWELGAPRM